MCSSEQIARDGGHVGQDDRPSAGVRPWPRLFHNLRASREAELMRDHDLAMVCKWIGNSPAVAAKHYATSQDLIADFRRAAGLGEAQQEAQESVAVSDGQEVAAAKTDEQKPRKTWEKSIMDNSSQSVATRPGGRYRTRTERRKGLQ